MHGQANIKFNSKQFLLVYYHTQCFLYWLIQIPQISDLLTAQNQTHVHMNVFLKITVTFTPVPCQNTTLSSRMTPYKPFLGVTV